MLLLACQIACTQSGLPLGSWRTYLSFNRAPHVTQTPANVVLSTGKGLLLLDKQEASTQRITRTDGLSGSDIRLIKYHPPTETIIVVYNSSVIDLYRSNGEVLTLPQIDNFNFSGGDNRINEVFVDDTNIAYLAAGYGVSAVDVERGIFLFSTFTDVSVRSVVVHENALWAGTDDGLYRVPLTGVNLNDFTRWELLGPASGFPEVYQVPALAVYQGQLYIGIDLDIFRLEPDGPRLFYDAEDRDWQLEYLSAEGANLLGGYRCLSTPCFDRQVAVFDANGLVREVIANCVGITNNAVQDEQGRIWFGDEWENIRVLDQLQGECRQLNFSGPFSDRFWELAVTDDELWAASGATTSALTPLFVFDGFYRLVDGQWQTFNVNNTPALNAQTNGGDDIFTFVDVVVNESTQKAYAASFFEGLVEVDLVADEIQIFNQFNSALQISTGAGDGRVRVGGMAVDEAGTLWMTNHLSDQVRPISALTAEGRWFNFGNSCGRNGLFDLTIDASGFKWAITDIGSGGGVVVFDEGDITDPNDDRCRVMTSANSQLPNNQMRSILADLNGDIWVGTTDGVAIFECGTSAFDPSICTGVRRVVERDGFTAELLETEEVISMAIDGGNRKWIGTTNGVFLLSPDGREEIAFFNTDNSPLLDNVVRSIAVNDRTGEVFFATDGGLISYQGDATAGGTLNRAELEIFPNPVRPNYEGPIAIRGLARNANVKITDLNGKLVFETTAQGGQATWNGTDYTGRRVQTGVYLIFATSDASGFGNPDTATGKVVFVR